MIKTREGNTERQENPVVLSTNSLREHHDSLKEFRILMQLYSA